MSPDIELHITNYFLMMALITVNFPKKSSSRPKIFTLKLNFFVVFGESTNDWETELEFEFVSLGKPLKSKIFNNNCLSSKC